MSGIVNCTDDVEDSIIKQSKPASIYQKQNSDKGEEKEEGETDQDRPKNCEQQEKELGKLEDPLKSEEKENCQLENNTDEKKRVGKKRKFLSFTCKMLSDLLVVGFLLSNLFSYVLNSNESVKRKTRKPEPFFDDNSLVRDYWEGNVFQAFKDAQHFESSFFMFYAAWDRESQESRAVIDSVAHFYRNSDMMIAGVNCWYPTSDCAKEFGGKNGTGHILPVFIFYPNTMNGIQFRGPVNSAHMIRFIEWSRWPVVHLQSLQHLQNLQVDYENVLVGYLPNTNTINLHPSHQELFSAALAFHEVLPEKPVCTAVVTSEDLANLIYLHPTKPVKLYTHNATFNFPNKTIDSDKLVHWTLSNLSPPTSWLNLMHKKSLNFKSVLERGSGNVLLLFSPRTELFQDKAYDILREVSMDYFNCDKSVATQNLVDKLKAKSAKFSSNPFPSCSHPKKSSCGPFSPSSSWTVTSPSSCHLRPWSMDSPEDNFPACTQASACAEKNSTGDCVDKMRVLSGLRSVDPNVELAIQEVELERKHSVKYNQGDLFSNSKSVNVDITGLGCTTNKTLRLYRVDSDQYQPLLERLGLEGKRPPLPVILNIAQESILYKELRSGKMEEDLRSLIKHWHSASLPQTGSQGYRSSDKESVIRYKVDLTYQTKPDSVIKELSGDSFSEFLSSDYDTILFITSSFCAECTAASQILHTAQLYLNSLKTLRFALIDGTRNDLKWEFNSFSYPAIIFFPRNRSSESRAFPSEESMSLATVLRFIVSNLSPLQRLTVNLQFCDTPCKQKVRAQCEKSIDEITSKLRRHLTSAVQLRHKLTRKLSYTKKLLRVINDLQYSYQEVTETISSHQISALFRD